MACKDREKDYIWEDVIGHVRLNFAILTYILGLVFCNKDLEGLEIIFSFLLERGLCDLGYKLIVLPQGLIDYAKLY